MKLASTLFLPLLSGLLLTVAVSAHDKEHCKLKDHKHHHHKHHKHAHQTHHHHKHHHHHHQHHNHNHTTPPSHVPGKKCGSLSPGGLKAGVSGQAAGPHLKSHISWMNNWQATAYDDVPKGITYVPECYGYNWSGHDLDYKRFEAFKKLHPGDWCYIIGGNELDFAGAESAGFIPAKEAAKLWDQWIAPHARAGAVTVSPSCAKQRDEDWMGPFLDAVHTKPDVVNVHLFSDKVEDITKVIEHYAKYGYPMWITEFACINFNTQHFCTQQETNDFIWNAIRIFEADDRIKAYSYADADNGSHCKLTTSDGQLSESGKTYLAALEKFGKGGGKMRRSMVASIDGSQEGEGST